MQNGQMIVLELAELAVPKCASCGELVFDYEAEQQINDALQQLLEDRRAAIAG
jgi:hypothetical protein